MKKTQLRVLLKNIWATKVSFFSILLFVALGIAIFLGIKWNQPSFNKSADGYYNEKCLYDFTVSFPYGVTEDDIDKLEAIDAVTLTEGGYTADGLTWVDQNCAVLAILSLSDKMNYATAVEGTLPSDPGEIGIERGMADTLGLEIGDVLTIRSERGGKNCLTSTDFLITAIVEHPAYISLSTSYARGGTTIGDGEQDFYVLVSESAFNKEAYDNCYSDVYLRCDSLRGINSFNDSYLEKADVIAAQIKELGNALGLARYTSVIDRYRAELDDAELKIKDAEAQIADGEVKIADAEAELADLEKKLADGEKEFAAAEKALSDGEAKLADANKQIAEAEKELAENTLKLNEARAQLLEATEKIKSGEAELADANRKYAAGQDEYQQYVLELAVARAQIQNICRQTNMILEKANAEFLKLPQDFQDALNAEFAKYGINPIAFRLSVEPAKAKVQFDELHMILEIPSLLTDSKISTLESLKEQIAAYQEQYGSAPDSSEKQTALTELHKTLEAEKVDDPDIDSALNKIEKQLYLFSPLRELLKSADTVLVDFSAKLEEYLNGETELDKANTKLQAAATEIEKNTTLLEEAKAEVNDAKIELADKAAQLNYAMKSLDDNKMIIADETETLESGKVELESNRTLLSDSKTKLENGKAELADKKAEFADGKTELTDNREKYENAKADFEGLIECERWQVKKRSDNFSYGIADAFSKSGRKLCYSLSILFVFVGVMVCYTAISRIVREQQVMTGVQKSLGFRRREIMAQYLSYAIIAVILGSVFGAALGYFVIEPIMNHSFAPNFLMGEFMPYFRFTDLLLISIAELLLIGFSAWLACHKLLAKQAVVLLRGNEDSVGRTHFYEKFRFWDKLSLYTQTTINNVVNDKTRVIATLVGVAGCTSLIVMALTVQMAMINTPAKHFSEVSVYDNRLVSDDEIPGAMYALSDVLKEEKVNYTEVYQKGFIIESASGELTSANLIIPSEPMNLSGFIRLVDKSSGKALAVPAEGVLISESYSRNYHVREGDDITLMDMTGKKYTCPIVGVTKHYLSAAQLVMSSSYYEKLTGNSAEVNTFLINLNGVNVQELDAKLKETPGYFTLSDDTVRWTALYRNYQSSISLMVYIALFLSAVMALLVILNLNVVLINEKTKELIVMRINGYSVGAAKKYIYRDNIVLTLLGTLIGVAVGIGLGALVTFSLTGKNSNLIMTPSLPSCLAGAAVSIVFSLITNLIALRRIGKLRVSDLNK